MLKETSSKLWTVVHAFQPETDCSKKCAIGKSVSKGPVLSCCVPPVQRRVCCCRASGGAGLAGGATAQCSWPGATWCQAGWSLLSGEPPTSGTPLAISAGHSNQYRGCYIKHSDLDVHVYIISSLYSMCSMYSTCTSTCKTYTVLKLAIPLCQIE